MTLSRNDSGRGERILTDRSDYSDLSRRRIRTDALGALGSGHVVDGGRRLVRDSLRLSILRVSKQRP